MTAHSPGNDPAPAGVAGKGTAAAIEVAAAGTATAEAAVPDLNLQALMLSRQPALFLDCRFRIRWCNNAALTLMACTQEQASGLHINEVSRISGGLERVSAERLRAGEQVTFELTMTGTQEPGLRHIDVELTPVGEAGGDGTFVARGYLALGIDVTERKLFEREANFLHLEMDRANEALYRTDEFGRIVFVNDAAVRMLGYPREELLGRHAATLHGDLPQPDWPSVLAELDAGRTVAIETLHRTRDGRALPVEVRAGSATIDGETRRSALARDISERHHAAAERASAHLKLRAILDAVADMVIVHDSTGRVIDCNARAEALFRMSPERREAFNIWELHGDHATSEEMRQRVLSLPPRQPFVGWREFGRGPAMVTAELRTERVDLPDGTSVWVLTSRDVSQQHREQQALEASRALLRQILDVLPQGVFWKDLDSRYLGANTAFLDDLGVHDVVGRSDAELPLPPGTAALFRSHDQQVISRAEADANVIESGQRPDGSPWWISRTKAPLLDAAGNVIGVIGTYLDITAIRESERALAFRAALAETVNRLHTHYVHATDTDALVNDILNDLLPLVGCDRGFIADPHERRHPRGIGTHRLWMRARVDGDADGTVMREVTEWHAGALRGLARLCTESGGLVVCNGPNDGLPLPPNVRNYLAMDLQLGDETLCCLGFADRADGFDIALVRALQPVFGTVAQLIAAWRTRLEREAAERALVEAKERAERAVRAKGMFLATMSHEIRTPLNAILGMTALLLDGEQDDERRNQLQIVMQSGDGLLAIINDVLDFSKAEAGELRLESNCFDPRRKCSSLRDLFEVEARRKGLTLDIDVADTVPPWLLGDAGRIRQLLANLLNNAIKFTEQGSVSLQVSGAPRPDGRFGIVFSVTDTGIGIAPAQQEGLFEPFTQADASMTRRFGGTGLGLAICRRLVHAMQGEIGLHSSPGRGSVFWFTLALPVADAPPDIDQAEHAFTLRAPRNVDEAPWPPSSPRVLVAEDNSVNQRVVTSMLRKLGCTVDVAANGFEAIDMFTRFPYDLILMDWQMPELDGIAATRAIRAQPKGDAVPIVALTANAMDGDEATCLAAGMDDYLTKPIRVAALREVLDRWATTQGRRQHPGDER